MSRPSGYSDCPCRDCFDVAMDGDLCHDCADAGCSPDGDAECERDDAYGVGDTCEHGNWACSQCQHSSPMPALTTGAFILHHGRPEPADGETCPRCGDVLPVGVPRSSLCVPCQRAPQCDDCGEAPKAGQPLHKMGHGTCCRLCRREHRAEFRAYVAQATAGRKVSRTELRDIMRDW